MKLCVIKRIDDGKFLGHLFEEPYRYSEYTSGGGEWGLHFGDKESILDCPETFTSDESFRLAIFESKKRAGDFIKKYEKSYGPGCKFEIVNIGDLK